MVLSWLLFPFYRWTLWLQVQWYIHYAILLTFPCKAMHTNLISIWLLWCVQLSAGWREINSSLRSLEFLTFSIFWVDYFGRKNSSHLLPNFTSLCVCVYLKSEVLGSNNLDIWKPIFWNIQWHNSEKLNLAWL